MRTELCKRLLTSTLAVGASLSAGLIAVVPVYAHESNESHESHESHEHAASAKGSTTAVKVLSESELAALLNQRINSTFSGPFGPFANMFFVRSNLETGTSIGLTTASARVGQMPLTPAFPRDYKCTLRELLDAIAMQIDTNWKYSPKDQIMRNMSKDVAIPDAPLTGVALFTFEEASRKPGFAMDPAAGWKVNSQGARTMYIPPTAEMGLDLHVCGKVSVDGNDPAKLADLCKSAPRDAALDELRRVKPGAVAGDLKQTKVGEYDAYFFEAWLPPNGEKKIHWRQWHLIVGNQLLFVISTLFKDQDESLYPDVEQMIKTFKVKEAKEVAL
jgi:hypothetical protein